MMLWCDEDIISLIIISLGNGQLSLTPLPHTPSAHLTSPCVFTTAVRHTLSPPPALQSAENRESLHKEIFRIYLPTSFSIRLSLSHSLTWCNSSQNIQEEEGGGGGINVKFLYIMFYQVICGMYCTLTVLCTLYTTIWTCTLTADKIIM